MSAAAWAVRAAFVAEIPSALKLNGLAKFDHHQKRVYPFITPGFVEAIVYNKFEL